MLLFFGGGYCFCGCVLFVFSCLGVCVLFLLSFVRLGVVSHVLCSHGCCFAWASFRLSIVRVRSGFVSLGCRLLVVCFACLLFVGLRFACLLFAWALFRLCFVSRVVCFACLLFRLG